MQNDSIAQYFDQLLDKQDRTVQIVFFRIHSVAKKLNMLGRLTPDEIDDAISTTAFVKKHGFWLVAEVELNVYALVRMAPPSESHLESEPRRALISAVEALVDQRLAGIDEVHEPDSKLAGWGRLGL